ncbi:MULTISPECIES: formyltetrahydrofolate deformylase [Oceanobacillus]|uniref:Formyltetrahydrofolate deformylase n=1 Tax=Oceanobacillus kimchii TaxID=746691 RepID=A0ABQ5TNL1_9BACI|nr:formyltetrahydrofolate deformylase [Oceanobacillus kimchii]GLO68394.1 formyltetrahydrofolate deformylase [Oceanobacillus kimchii]
MASYRYRIRVVGEYREKTIKNLVCLLEDMSISIHSKKALKLEDGNILIKWIEVESDYNLLYNNKFKNFLIKFEEEFCVDIEIKTINRKKNMAIFVSNQGHCLEEILFRWKNGELDCNIPLVISDYDIYRKYVESYGIKFYNLKVNKHDKKRELIALRILEENCIDFISLARYMQILPINLVNKYINKIINIHHSLLPAFIGANTYQRAFDRGVKVIGSTTHYVTDKLDEGPILIQKSANIEEGSSVKDYKNLIRITETENLFMAIKYHIDDKVFVYNNKAILLK